MVTTVTVSREKANPAGPADIKDEQEYLVSCRKTMDAVQRFVEDRASDKLINMGRGPGVVPALPPERIDEMVRAGIGTSGIFTVVEPADLDLYRSYLQPPLTMPEKPEVSVMLVDFNRGNPVTRYQEGWILIKALCPDGKEGRFVVSMPVPNLLMCWMGVGWGLPKYVADEMTVTPTKAEVFYEGEVRYSLEMTPGPVEDEASLRTRVISGIGPMLTFHPTTYGSCLLRIGVGVGGGGGKIVDVQTGMVKSYIRPEDPWSGLIPTDLVAPGVYQRLVAGGGGDSVWEKVKG
jgi:hypothetical protein